LRNQNKIVRFEQCVLPHLDAAYNLARWLTHNEQDAEDVVQESYLRAFKFFDGFHSSDSRPWLLAIIRNTYYTLIQQKRVHDVSTPFDEEIHGLESQNPEGLVLQNIENQLLREAIKELPVEFREVIVLRELEGLSYKEIADIAAVPLGTVMSRLARARKRLQHYLTQHMDKES